MPLPARLTSLYRVTLRALSASVLHQRRATRNLRALYRPAFEEAARVAKRLEAGDASDREKETWFTEWEERMHNTLLLHLNSARHAGLSHRITKNLGALCMPVLELLPYAAGWNADPNMVHAKRLIVGRVFRRRVDLGMNADRVLQELRQAAEGRARVVLGKTEIRRPLRLPEH